MSVWQILTSMSPLEATAVAFGVAYLVLAIRQNILCWHAALVNVLLSLVLFYERRLYSESALQLFYAAMAVYGWYEWRYGGRRTAEETTELPVSTWPVPRHALAIGVSVLASAAIGWLLAHHTQAAFPYLDTFTSVSAIVTTYMVAKKILENWLYWIVLDSISVYLYVARDLYLYALLSVVYVALAVLGFVRWRRDWRERAVPAPA